MEYTPLQIWNELRDTYGAVPIDTPTYESVVYKGVKMVKDEDGIQFLCTATEYYKPIKERIVGIFLTQGIDAGVREYRRDKYIAHMERFGETKAILNKLESL